MPYLVQKPIPAGETTLQPGTVVTGEGWRNLKALVAGRYLTLVEDEIPAPAKPAAAKPKRTTTRSSTVKDDHVGTH